MISKKALEDIILYLNANEPKGLYCENIEVIKQDLERLEKLEKENQELKKKTADLKKVIDFLKLNFNISLDSKLRIDDGSECVQTFLVHLPENTTIDEMFEIIPEVLCNE